MRQHIWMCFDRLSLLKTNHLPNVEERSQIVHELYLDGTNHDFHDFLAAEQALSAL